ncbi:MAG: Gfo/Idh/MocA family oxidoreductase [Victivallales bacterium]
MSYKAVILGCGPRAGFHLDAYKENLPEIKLAAACDTNEARRLEYGKKYSIPRLYSDFETMLKTEKPDILHVVTPPVFREQALELAGKYGVKGVLMEKPLALTVTQAERVRAVAEKYHLKVAINMQRRYFDHCRALREIIRSNRLGTIEFVRCVTRGNILSMGPHAIDLTLFLLDNPSLQKIWATGYAMNGHEYGHPAPAHILGRINFAPDLTVYLEDADDAVGVFGENGGYWQHMELDIWGGRGRAWWKQNQDWGYQTTGMNEPECFPTGWFKSDELGQREFTRAMAHWLDDDRCEHDNSLRFSLQGYEVLMGLLQSAYDGEIKQTPFRIEPQIVEKLSERLEKQGRILCRED